MCEAQEKMGKNKKVKVRTKKRGDEGVEVRGFNQTLRFFRGELVPLKMEGKALEVLSEEYVGGTMIGVPM